jgi:hypothetical protein
MEAVGWRRWWGWRPADRTDAGVDPENVFSAICITATPAPARCRASNRDGMSHAMPVNVPSTSSVLRVNQQSDAATWSETEGNAAVGTHAAGRPDHRPTIKAMLQ